MEKKFRAYYPKKKKYIYTGFSIIGEVTVFDMLKNVDSISDYPTLIIEQFTGIKDKKGVDIYEGDIINYRISSYTTFKGTIIYLHNAFVVRSFKGNYSINRDLQSNRMEAIGNINENPNHGILDIK